MNRLELALRTFFWIFFNKRFAKKIEQFFFESPKQPESKEKIVVKEKIEPKKRRSEAVQIIGMLQREGRLVDFLKESIDSYSDSQIGAAVRDIHRDCAAVVDRVFAIEPLVKENEGDTLSVLQGFDPEEYHLTGNLTGNPPYKGILRHHGWRAKKVELPVWNGNSEAANVIAAAEVELP
ncbi:MAG TPA: DUF2760 domain-containing protein [Chitinispirillaceae bacterium]|jgi:hypothetical protein|nr:DUF2760 domain-containing protein [Chitinispirillaceae bacterium]